jgi:outer membrane protein assembly factor BamB
MLSFLFREFLHKLADQLPHSPNDNRVMELKQMLTKPNTMKTKYLIVAFLLASTNLLFAQVEFKKEWETKVKVENKWKSCNADLSLILMGNERSFSMIDGTNGKTLWTINAKEKFGTKEVEEWTFLSAKDGEPVEVIYQNPKTDAKTIVYLDPRTAEIKTSFTEADLVDKKAKSKNAKTKTWYTNEAFDEASGTWVTMKYDDKNLTKSKEGELTISSTGGYTWSTKIKAKCVRHLCRNLLSSDEPEMMVNMMIVDEKVFVVFEGISVFDLKLGKELWYAPFDNIKSSSGAKSKLEIGLCAMPLVTKDAVYICDMHKGEQTIKKLDITTGAVIWKGEKGSGDDIISQFLATDSTLIVKYGSTVRYEKFIANSNGNIEDGICEVEYSYEGDSRINAFDIQSGKLLWNSDVTLKENKLGESESPVMINDGNLIVCSEKSFLLIDPLTGKIKHKDDLGTKNIGTAQNIFVYDTSYIVEGNEGIASFTLDGKKSYATSTDKRLKTEFKNDAFIVWVGSEQDDLDKFVRFDLTTGKVLGTLKGCYRPRFDETGNYFIRFNEQTITKHKTSL